MFRFKHAAISACLLALAVGSSASSFRAADQIYLPAAGKLAGGNNSFFRTDVFITNLSSDSVTVSAAFAPGNAVDNANVPRTAINLPNFAPRERREIVDIMGAVFNVSDTQTAFGQILFFGCRAGGDCRDCDANPADCRPITVQARIYTTAADGSTFGQLIPGIPWYNFVSSASADRSLDTVFITGIRNTAAFRTNIGLANASQTATVTLRVTLFNNLGVAQGQPFDQVLPPLGQIQRSVASMFPAFTGATATNAYVTIREVGFTGENPGFLAYGSLLDNRSNDPTYLETQFTQELPFSCVYGSKPIKRFIKRQ